MNQPSEPHILLRLLAVSLLAVGSTNAAEPLVSACPENALSCEFHIRAALRYTMVFPEGAPVGTSWVPVEARDDGLYTTGQPANCQGEGRKLTDEEAATVIIGDGNIRTVFAVNESVPGPPIVVFEGQQIIIHFTNNLENEAATLHLHGLHQRGTPWMDGAGQVSHCPIAPGETFTYRVKADPSGTFWYHAHHGAEFSMGLHGALVVLYRNQKNMNAHRPLDPLPSFSAHYALVVQDWMDVTSAEVSAMSSFGAAQYAYGFGTGKCNQPSFQPDGAICSLWPFYSAIINGKGRYYKITEEGEHVYTNPFTPLEVFPVTEGDKYYFRVICSALTFPFSISIDGHPLHVVASDGHHIVTEVVDFLILTSGERYDFWIEATNPDGLGNFWIRAETLEVDFQELGNPMRPNHVEAILRYSGSPPEDPKSTRRECTKKNPCRALNCPYRIMPEKFHTECVTLEDLRLPYSEDANFENDDEVVEHFFDFQINPVAEKGGIHPIINGIRHRMPPYPPQIFKEQAEDLWIPCDFESCPGVACACSHVVKVPLDTTVHLVFFSAAGVDDPRVNPHPIHIHGYTPQVVKMGWPTYYDDTQRAKRGTDDIICDDPLCKGGHAGASRWAEASWRGGHIEGMQTTYAPHKDTVIVPTGGYVVLRFKADNPGFWFLHCHIEDHGLDGMALVIQVGEPSDMTSAPGRMTRCGDFSLTEVEYYNATGYYTDKKVLASAVSDEGTTLDDIIDSISTESQDVMTSQGAGVHYGYQIATYVLAAMCLCLLLGMAALYRKYSYRRDYVPLLFEDETSATVSGPTVTYNKGIITKYYTPAE